MSTDARSIHLHKKLKGKIAIVAKTPVKNRTDLSLVYTPGVASVSRLIQKKPKKVADYTMKGNFVAVISDGSAVLGLGNIGPEAALPVMEGKCLLFKEFAGIDAIPIVLSTQDPQKIIETVVAISPTFGGINLEDIAAPACFFIEEELKKQLDIPIVHDDQWGASVVVLAALINALKVVNKKIADVKIVFSGAGAAGSAAVKILTAYGAKNILVCDRKGIIFRGRDKDNHKEKLAQITNPANIKGALADAMKNADVFIGLSSAGLVKPTMVKTMNKKPIIFALANPVPEIMPDVAKRAGAYITATGRSDFPNQINNALVFPGIFRGALDHRVKGITVSMLIKAAKNLAALVKKPKPDEIIPSIFEKGVVETVASAIEHDIIMVK